VVADVEEAVEGAVLPDVAVDTVVSLVLVVPVVGSVPAEVVGSELGTVVGSVLGAVVGSVVVGAVVSTVSVVGAVAGIVSVGVAVGASVVPAGVVGASVVSPGPVGSVGAVVVTRVGRCPNSASQENIIFAAATPTIIKHRKKAKVTRIPRAREGGFCLSGASAGNATTPPASSEATGGRGELGAEKAAAAMARSISPAGIWVVTSSRDPAAT